MASFLPFCHFDQGKQWLFYSILQKYVFILIRRIILAERATCFLGQNSRILGHENSAKLAIANSGT